MKGSSVATFAGVSSEFSFGRFRLLPGEQILLEDEKPVRLGSRALDILTMLVEHAGELVSRDELTARVWPDTFVEESSLRVHIAGLRRALGDGHAGNRYVANIPGRGYRFVAPVAVSEETGLAAPKAPTAAPTHNLPASLIRMIGRDAVTNTLSAELPRRRFITLVGPGGIGKTTVALDSSAPSNIWVCRVFQLLASAPVTWSTHALRVRCASVSTSRGRLQYHGPSRPGWIASHL
jgi:DNA-binding winged helix-turn-helix (wHTH) protein